ncbi:hypothetical protein KSD_50900 [Ktedonobacter sp. SOSP1-85]|nr:hypothetical protein KSD_50900 [Ktedonobacter sp. SOSP1-85]
MRNFIYSIAKEKRTREESQALELFLSLASRGNVSVLSYMIESLPGANVLAGRTRRTATP